VVEVNHETIRITAEAKFETAYIQDKRRKREGSAITSVSVSGSDRFTPISL